jgi:hypothetical protein
MAAGFLPPREADEQPESVDYRDHLGPDGEAAGAQASLRMLQGRSAYQGSRSEH